MWGDNLWTQTPILNSKEIGHSEILLQLATLTDRRAKTHVALAQRAHTNVGTVTIDAIFTRAMRASI